MQVLTRNLRDGADLTQDDVHHSVEILLDESIEAASKADFLEALHQKGETAEEIAGFVKEFLRLAVNLEISENETGRPLIDLCGTGGDKLELFNISTAAMFIVAAAGSSVVKHGNRGITSKSGGADVLEVLGVKIDLPPDRAKECVLQTGAVFLFAPRYHPAFKAVVPVRKLLAERGSSSVFNMLGPLLNPCHPDYQMVGVFNPNLLGIFPEIFRILSRKCAWTVHGSAGNGQGMDEVSTVGETKIGILEKGETRSITLTPDDFGLASASVDALKGGDAAANAKTIYEILKNQTSGPMRDIVIANAATALTVCGIAEEPRHGTEIAARQIKDGNALRVLERMQAF